MRHVRMLGVGLIAALVASAMMAASASAAPEPTKSFGIFKNCPVFSNPLTELCAYGNTRPGNGGFYRVGKITVPVVNSIRFQGGLHENQETGELEFLYPENGQAVIPVEEPVPGEPLGYVTPAEMEAAGWPAALEESYVKAKKKKAFAKNKVKEEIQTAGLPGVNTTNTIFEEGVGLKALIKIVGKNKWLEEIGGNCEIGSEAEPIVQNLTTGTSEGNGESIKGSAGELEILHEGDEVWLHNIDYVDHTYAVPGAHGCGGPENEAYLDPVVDNAFGIPAAAGTSVTSLEGTFYLIVSQFLKEKGYGM